VLKRHLRGKLKVANGHLHMFRHTFARRQLQAGVPAAVVSKILGHGSVSTTLNIYAHVLAEHMEQFERQRARILGTYRAPDVPPDGPDVCSSDTSKAHRLTLGGMWFC
jgi:integrase